MIKTVRHPNSIGMGQPVALMVLPQPVPLKSARRKLDTNVTITPQLCKEANWHFAAELAPANWQFGYFDQTLVKKVKNTLPIGVRFANV